MIRLISLLLILVVVTGCDLPMVAQLNSPKDPANGGAANLMAAPSGISASSGNSTVTLNWAAVSGASSYRIYRATTSGFAISSQTKIGSATTNTYTDAILANGTTYYYVITALSSGGESSPSVQVSATPGLSAVGAPTGLVATAASAKVVLSWNSVSGAASYNVYRSINSGFIASASTKLANSATNNYTDTSAGNGTLYYYVVIALNAGGESLPSSQVSVVSSTLNSSPITGIYAGYNHQLYLLADGTLWGVGDNSQGQLGTPSLSSSAVPVRIASHVTAVAAATNDTFFVESDGTLWATGGNANGELGVGTLLPVTSPINVMAGVASVSSNCGTTYAVKSDGTVWSCGNNSSGQLGAGTSGNGVTMFVQRSSGVASTSAGWDSFVIDSSANLFVAGPNGTPNLWTTLHQIATNVAQVASSGGYGGVMGVYLSGGTGYVCNIDSSNDAWDVVPFDKNNGLVSSVFSGGNGSLLYTTVDGSLWNVITTGGQGATSLSMVSTKVLSDVTLACPSAGVMGPSTVYVLLKNGSVVALSGITSTITYTTLSLVFSS